MRLGKPPGCAYHDAGEHAGHWTAKLELTIIFFKVIFKAMEILKGRMNVLSVDVGMKCLAICLFEITEPGKYAIRKWQVLDLTGATSSKCLGKRKDGSACTSTPRFRLNGQSFCKMHAKRQARPLPPQDLLAVGANTRIADVRRLADKYSVELPKGARKSECIRCLQGFLGGKYMEAIVRVDARSIDLATYGRRLKVQLETSLEGIKLDHVVIENQIGPQAIRMKVLQGMIMQHFIERGCQLIVEVSPANKLKAFLGESKRSSYSERKKLAVTATRGLISGEAHARWRPTFEAHKKKDDLADAFLQGVWYLNNGAI